MNDASPNPPSAGTPCARHIVERFAREVEATLRSIDFPEVTLSDRIVYIDCAVAWRIRQALAGGSFDLAVQLRRFGRRCIAELRSAHARDPHPPTVRKPPRHSHG